MANIKISQLPAKGANLGAQDLVEVAEFTGTGYVSKSITGQEIIDAASGGGAAWGSITGTLSSQTDLNTALSGKQANLVSGTNIKTLEGQSLLGSGNIDLTKSDVGLANVDNTSDLNKPISTATQTALNAKQNTLVSGTSIKTINGNSVLGSGNLTISGGGTNPTSTYIPINNAGVFADSVLYQFTFGFGDYLYAQNLAGVNFTDAFGANVANLAGTFGNTTIGPNGYQIGNNVFESAMQLGSAMTQTGTHTTISKWLKTIDENENIYYIPLYL